MSFHIAGLAPANFEHLFGLSDEALAERGVVRRIADSKPGFPCRITLRDAESGEAVLLLNHESHSAPTPYRSAYAIFVGDGAREAAIYEGEVPPVMRKRPMALRHFNRGGMLIGASLALNDDARDAIVAAFNNAAVAYIDVHNAAHGCFSARVQRGRT